MKLTDGYKQFLIERLGTRAKSLELSEKKGEISSAQQETLDSFRIAIAALSECWQERAEKAESVLRCKDIELAGAIERTRTLFKYKNEWADRARKAESQLAELAKQEPVAWTSKANIDALASRKPKQLEFMTGDKSIYREPVELFTRAAPPAPFVDPGLLAQFNRHRLLQIIVTGPDASGAEQNTLARIALAFYPKENSGSAEGE